ncbi:MAG: acetyl-CoA C-acyltransferase [Pelagimonas sp.]|jgi:acetyl-CoA acetyltransferase family protein|nr:acetyl-CoA C-acyltransferase [Pelagimonas sp.]
MDQAVIVSAARTGLAKAFRGSFNNTHGASMGGHVVQHAVARAGIDPDSVEDCIMGCGFPQTATGHNIARQIALRAGLPNTTSGMTVNRFCSSGLQSIAMAAQAVKADGSGPIVAGGLESISLVQPTNTQVRDPWMEAHMPDIYMTMIETADIVAKRYDVSRDAQDEYGLRSQQRIAAAQENGLFADEIVPMETVMQVKDKETGEVSERAVTVTRDECNRPNTTLDSLQGLDPVREGGFITAGNASQLSDGAAAVVVMSESDAARQGLSPMGAFKGFAVAGCAPDEMGIGPVFAVPRLLERHGLTVQDIDLWELNEAFASQALYCRDRLGIDPDIYNVNGGSIAIGHPFGMTGARMVGHILREGKRRGAKLGVVSMCIGGGMGAAGLVEIY